MQSLIPEAEQESLLQEALSIVKAGAFEMKRCLDRHEIMDGLRHASLMLSELRTSFLTPKYYYRLYIDVTNELQHFLSYLTDNYLEKESMFHLQKITELYETVQYTGNIIPRIYLMITVGVVYIKSGETTAKDVLVDLVEMCRGVQHPLRGLFLRNYLLSVAKEFIPDFPSQMSVETLSDFAQRSQVPNSVGDVVDGIEFIMINFAEMNKLWVRMQHLGPSKERTKRERERRELRILVGTNLVRLSQLENLTLDIYQKIVLPRILEQSVSCKDPISQEYLMECVIQVFPDNFHLKTLDEFLKACANLAKGVQIKNILATLIDHLTMYIVSDEFTGIPEGIDLFQTFSCHAEKVTCSKDMPPEDVISIQIALLNLALTCYKENTSYPNTVFSSTSVLFEMLEIKSILYESVIGRELMKLLKLPLDHYISLDNFLKLTSYPDVLAALDFRGRTYMSTIFIQTLIRHDIRLESEHHVDQVFNLINSLLYDQPDQSQEANGEEGCEQVAQLVHLIHNDDVEYQFKLLSKVRKIFGHGGKVRLGYTLPPTIFCLLKLLDRYMKSRDEIENFHNKSGKLFHFYMNTVKALRLQAEMPEMALRFYLQGAYMANKILFDKSAEVVYELISLAITVYEEDISDSKEQVQALTLLIATIQQISCLTDESHEPLRNRCALFATKLIKRPDQVRLVCLAARLFWFSKIVGETKYVRNGQRVAECLKKAVKISSQCMEEVVQNTLFIHVLAEYFYFYEEGCAEIKPEVINHLIDKVRDSIGQLEPSPEADQLNETFKNLLDRIRLYQTSPPEDSDISFDKFVL